MRYLAGPFVGLCLASTLIHAPGAAATDPPLLTIAEQSNYQATARHADVVEFCQKLAKESPLIRFAEIGKSHEGRSLPLLLLADPPVQMPEEAAKSGKLVVLAFGNIHAGEVCGKEGVLMLARDLALAQDRPLLKDLVIAIVPILNADGNERMSPANRTHQPGPVVGVRQNAQGFDLNRDFVKLESPEVRALVQFLNRWDPALVVDTHTTNGSYHRYTITYDAPRNPATDAPLLAFAQEQMLADLTRRLEKRGGWKSFFYGNFTRNHELWETYPAQPRFGVQYIGLRNRIAVLSEAYAYAPFKDRVLATRDFTHVCFEFVAENKEKLRTLLHDTDERTVKAGTKPTATDKMPLQYKEVPWPNRFDALGYVEEQKDGRRVSTGQPRDYPLFYLGKCEPTLEVHRPFAYFLPANQSAVAEKLQQHGIAVETLTEPAELPVEIYRVDKIARLSNPFQNHRLVSVQTTARKEMRKIDAGTLVVRTAQRLGTLVAYLLEPLAEDGLCTWGFFDTQLTEGQDFPVVRLTLPQSITTERSHK
jgi:hypothetical protein